MQVRHTRCTSPLAGEVGRRTPCRVGKIACRTADAWARRASDFAHASSYSRAPLPILHAEALRQRLPPSLTLPRKGGGDAPSAGQGLS
jgi:hypothetical protein